MLCHFAERRSIVLNVVVLSVIMLNVDKLSVMAPTSAAGLIILSTAVADSVRK